MLRHLHTVAAVLFYLLGSGTILSVVLIRNEIGGKWPIVWLENMDLPLLFAGLLYGALSIILSLKKEKGRARVLTVIISTVALLLFLGFAVLNFWPLLPR